MRVLIAMMLTLSIPIIVESASGIEIPVELRTRNIGGRCAWACLETAANVTGEPRLRGLVNRRGGLERDARQTYDRGETYKIGEQLKKLGVRYYIEPDYTHDYGTLEKYAKSRGVTVSLYKGSLYMEGRTLTECHAVLVTDIDSEHVHFFCPDNPWRIWRGTRGWFKTAWTGSAVVILPDDDVARSNK